METDDLRLDGNAVAGLLGEVFSVDLTGGRARCEGCGQVAELGADPVYSRGPGAVLRCKGCDAVLVVVVRGAGRYWLGFTGTSWIEVPDTPLH